MTAHFTRRLTRTLLLFALTASGLVAAPSAQAPQVGPNVNMVSGTGWPNGDPFLQRQNEGSIAVSTRNPLHLLAGANDYRTVDIPGLEEGRVTGDAWLGVFKSFDGGMTWNSTLLEGYPQQSNSQSPLHGYEAGADPTVRAGTNGLFYYSGIVFDRSVALTARNTRGKAGKPASPAGDRARAVAAADPFGASAVFVARFIDNNNRPNGDPIDYIGAAIIKSSPGAVFIDKPWLAVDIPRLGAQICTIPSTQDAPAPQKFYGGRAYATFTEVEGTGTSTQARVMFSRSADCGQTWSTPVEISSGHQLNQGSSMAINPLTGELFVVWRRLKAGEQGDAIMVAKSSDGGETFTLPIKVSAITPFDQGTSFISTRSTAYPTIVFDYFPRVYVAWSNRGIGPEGDARIVMSISDGRVSDQAADDDDFDKKKNQGMAWSVPFAVDNPPLDPAVPTGRGHQIMPSLSFAAGKLMLIYYDLRLDHTAGVYTKDPATGALVERREAAGDLPGSPQKVFSPFLAEAEFMGFGSDGKPTFLPTLSRRHTIDVVAAQASPGDAPVFSSTRLSRYRAGSRPNSSVIEQFQYNPPLLPLFACGKSLNPFDCRPFFGDYIDLTAAPPFRTDPFGLWIPNVLPTNTPVFHAIWTDNRDVRPPPDGNWANYTPPNSAAFPGGGASLFDPTQPRPSCTPSGAGLTTAGMRNQNVYSARITGGLYVSAHDNSKQLGSIKRAFAVTVQNATDVVKSFRLRLRFRDGVDASFLQFSSLTVLDVSIAARSSISRPVFVLSSDRRAKVTVDVTEITAPGGNVTSGGLTSDLVLNPDITNPDITNPDITNAEIYNPDITNPDITNPDITNPDITNPDITNPDITNPDITNPDITNPDITNPDITNPDITNPDITNPDITNPDITNGALTDATWEVTNEGTTAASYAVKLLLNGNVPAGFKFQLILHRVYTTPVPDGCNLGLQSHNVLVTNIRNPVFTNPADLTNPDITNPDITNATLALAPGEKGRITLRIVDPNRFDAITFNVAAVTPAVVSHAVNTADAAGGDTTPPTATPDAPVLAVTNTNDSGAGSLRAALLGANANFGTDTIAFNIPDAGPHTILLGSPLPAITSPVVLDGTTQPGYDGSPIITLVGTDAGSNPGLDITAGHSVVRGLVIRSFPGVGIRLSTRGQNLIEGNYVGIDQSGLENGGNGSTGVEIIDSPENIIGGTTSAARNVISANGGEGILIAGDTATGNVVQGNYIGTNAPGSGDLGNTNSGVYIRRASGNVVKGNLVSGNNGFAGIAICGSVDFCGGGGPGTNTAGNNQIQGNLIGRSVAGTALGNAGYGVSIDGASNTLVGGALPAASNEIAFNGGAGVVVFQPPANRNQIQNNSIHSNTGLGIDLGGDGVTGNDAGDADEGPNNLQNFPVLTSVSGAGGSTTISGTLNSAALTKFVLAFFSSNVCNATGHGEGQSAIGMLEVTTNSDGNVSFAPVFPLTIPAGARVTATATDPFGNTSEFSACSDVPEPPVVLFGVNSGNDGLSVYDPATGASTFRGRLSPTLTEYTTPVAAAVRPSDDLLYVWNNSNEGAPTGVLLAVDPCTARGAPVNSLTGPQGQMGGIAFAPDGRLFGAGLISGTDGLFSIGPENGTKSAVGTPWAFTVGGLTFDAAGTLYALTLNGQNLHTIDPDTGAPLVSRQLTLDGDTPANVGVVGSITFASNGTLIGSANGGTPGNVLFDINPTTGVVSNFRTVTGSGGNPQGMDFAPDCPFVLTFRTKSLPGATTDFAYRAALRAAGGEGPYTWTVVSGSLPPGLSLDPSGVISGTPTTNGTFTFAVQATDSAAPPAAATRTLTIVVQAPIGLP